MREQLIRRSKFIGESRMTANGAFSNRDTLLLTAPLLILMFLGIFRLDQRLATPKTSRRARRDACGVDANGREILCDPDGRPIPTATQARAAKPIAAKIQ
jgi:hypothetical protein